MKKFFALMLLFIPATLASHFGHGPGSLTLVLAMLGIVPLAHYLGEATENISTKVGSMWAGVLNATMGNAVELIIAVFALAAGEQEVVQATLAGSIISNLLLVFGLSAFVGGLKFREQQFRRRAVDINSTYFTLAFAMFMLVTTFHTGRADAAGTKHALSLALSGLLLVAYAAFFLFTYTHPHHFNGEEGADAGENEVHEDVNLGFWIAVLLGVMVSVCGLSEILVHHFEEASSALGFNKAFMGVILLPIVGNAAEHATAVTAAYKGKMNIAFTIATQSSLQIAIFVTPILVILGVVLQKPLDLTFEAKEIAALVAAMFAYVGVVSDGETNWLEGFLLILLYVAIGVVFFFY